MYELTHCIKRNGKKERFNKKKIQAAILKAFKSSGEGNVNIAKKVTNQINDELGRIYKDEEIPHIEEIQDVIEESLMRLNFTKTAKEYIIYRYERNKKRP